MSISTNQSKPLITGLSRGASPINGFAPAERWAIILAGGDGLPRKSLLQAGLRGRRPRHFCRTPGSDFVISQTRQQVSFAFPREKTMFVVSENHLSYCDDVLKDVPRKNLIIEPQDDGTTFSILYSLLRLRETNPNALVTFFPADFSVREVKSFMAQVKAGHDDVRRQPNLILLGIEPENPDENREWIEPDLSSPLNEHLNVWRVRDFRENVSRFEARELMKRGGLWNSRVMVGTISTFLRKIRRATPEIYESFIAAESKIGTPGETFAMRRIYYGNYANTDFSRDVLAKSADKLAVIPVPAAKVRGIGIEPPLIAAPLNVAGTAFKSMAAAAGRG